MNRILVALALGAGIAIGATATFTRVPERSTDARNGAFELDAGSTARERSAATSAAAVSPAYGAAAAGRSDVEADPDRAFHSALALPPLQRGSAIHAVLMRSVQPGQDPTAMAERLLALDDPQLKDVGIQTLLQMWGMHQPRQALDWLLENIDRVPPETVRGVAQLFASQNPTLAAAQLTRISNGARADWFAGVVQGYAKTDPHEGASWLGQFRGEPGYEDAVATLAPQLAREDGAGAARLLETVADSRLQVFEEAAMAVIDQWSQQNPRAAAHWVVGIENKRVRAVALPMLAGTWAADDFPAARDWVLLLPAGLERDAALTHMLFDSANADAEVDRAMTDAFSNDAGRQQAVLHIVAPVAKMDPARARVLLSQYLPDPAQRERVEKLLESIESERPSPPSPGRDIVRTPPPGVVVRPGLLGN
jgi:hypothetical protein